MPDYAGTMTVGNATVATIGQAAVNLYSEAAAARTTNGNTTNQTWVSGVSVAFVGINITGLAGGTSPTVTVTLQQQDGNAVFQTIATTAALAAVGVATFSVGPGTSNGAMLVSGGIYRFAWTIAGAPTTCTFQIGMQGR